MDDKIEKSTDGDLRTHLSNAVYYGYGDYTVYLQDYDSSQNLVYINKDGVCYSASYSMMGDAKPVIDFDSMQEVIRNTEYVTFSETVEKSVSNAIRKLLGKEQKTSKEFILQKNIESELEYATIEPLYVAPEEFDLTGDTISVEETIGMVDSMNEAIESGLLKSSYFHKVFTDDFKIVKAWSLPFPCKLGDESLPAHQPFCKLVFKNLEAYEARKDGDLLGISIGCRFEHFEELDDEEA